MKKYILILFLSSLYCGVYAQNQNSEVSSMIDEFNSFREEINNEYTQFLGQAWKEFKVNKVVEYGPSPITTPPIKPEGGEDESPQEINIVEASIQREPTPVNNKYLKAVIDDNIGKNLNIDFYGAPLSLYYTSKPFTVNNPISEKEVVSIWSEILQSNYTLLLADLAKYKEELQLNDGAFYLMTERVINQISSLKDDNQRAIFHLFILIESGYDARIARINNYLTLLIPTYEYIYGYPYATEFDGQRYHVFTNKKIDSSSKIYTYEIPHNIKRQSNLSFKFKQELLLPSLPYPFSLEYDDIVIKGEINKNKIDFYSDYPICELSVYKHSKSDDNTLDQISISLKAQLNNYNTYDAINKLLSLVQYGLEYKNDTEHFGYEKPLFVDEILYYTYSDCEDRSIFLSHLVENIFQRETLFLDYPNHIAVAINIDPNGVGRYFKYANKTYTCCDPTYAGSKLGDCMELFKNVTPKIIE